MKEQKNKMLTMRITSTQLGAIDAIAKAGGMRRTRVIEIALNDFLMRSDNNESAASCQQNSIAFQRKLRSSLKSLDKARDTLAAMTE